MTAELLPLPALPAQSPPPPRRTLTQLIGDYNPFYLLSAACMLFGVFAMNDSLDWSPLPMRNLLRMIITLNVYEIVVIGLATFFLRRGIKRDALFLLIVEAFFLADVGFLNMEVFARDAKIGLLVNAIVLAAAVVKVGFVFHAAKIPLLDARFALVVMELAVLFAVPGLFAVIAQPRHEVLPALAIYAGWWLAGALPVAYVLTVGSLDLFRKRPDGGPASVATIVSRAMIVVPMLSLLAHLCLSNWVYKVTFHPLNVAPLLIGVAVLAGHADRHVVHMAARMRLHLVLPFAAIALSAIPFPRDLIFPMLGLDMSPLRLVLLVSAITYLDGLLLHRHGHFAWAAGMCLALAGMGSSVGAINDNAVQVAKSSSNALRKLIPKTLREWGVLSVGASFVLLALGALVSLTRRTSPAIVVEENANDSPQVF